VYHACSTLCASPYVPGNDCILEEVGSIKQSDINEPSIKSTNTTTVYIDNKPVIAMTTWGSVNFSKTENIL
jgi:hypothetical protein